MGLKETTSLPSRPPAIPFTGTQTPAVTFFNSSPPHIQPHAPAARTVTNPHSSGIKHPISIVTVFISFACPRGQPLSPIPRKPVPPSESTRTRLFVPPGVPHTPVFIHRPVPGGQDVPGPFAGRIPAPPTAGRRHGRFGPVPPMHHGECRYPIPTSFLHPTRSAL